MTNYIEFSTQIKEKYPQYKDIDDLTLAQKMVEKYPEYKEKVTFEKVEKVPNKKGIDLTPSGLLDKVANAGAAAVLTPAQMIADKNINPIESYKNAYDDVVEATEKAKERTPVMSGIKDFATDLAGYAALPVLRGSGAANFIGNAAIQGGVPGALESLKRGGNVASGAGVGSGIAAALQGISPIVGNAAVKAVNSNFVQNTLPKVLEGLTSVPAEYVKRALGKEIAGQSILSGKFNPENAYIPIEQKLKQAKESLPNAVDFGNQYYNLGQKALEGIENLKNQAGAKISEVLGQLENKELQNGGIQAAVKTVIDSFGKGGVYNSARSQAPNVVKFLENELNKEGLTLMDLHRIKEDLYNMGYALDGLKQGTSANVARKAAEQINNYLRGVAPDYAQPNDLYSLVMDVTRGLDGQTTMGSKLSEIGSVNSAKSGLDARLQALDNLLPQENKFYKQAQDIINSENEIGQILGTIGKQYERNPRLLANRTDETFENAISDLQNRSNVNFMDELNDLRAREALEKWFPGQGGGSGSSQGFGNLLRNSIAGVGLPTTATITHNPWLLLGVPSVSPKFMAQGTIKNIGKLNDIAQNAVKGAYDDVIRKFITPLMNKGAANMLYGGVEYNDYR